MVNKKKDTHTAIYELLLAQTVERHVFLIGQF